MSKLLAIIVLSLILLPSVITGDNTWDNHVDVSISTSTATLVHGITSGRKCALTVNTNRNYDVRITTYANTNTTTGILLGPGGFWEDTYYVHFSSYYAIAVGQASTVNYSEKW